MKTIHKLLALALCLTLLCGAVSATMRETGTSGLKLADEVTYTHTSWSNDQKEGQYLQEHTLTYTAGGGRLWQYALWPQPDELRGEVPRR